jgi:hypothetical protein
MGALQTIRLPGQFLSNGVVETVEEVLGDVDVEGDDLGGEVLLVGGVFADLYDLLGNVGVVDTAMRQLLGYFLGEEELVQFEDILKDVHSACLL